MIGIIGAVCGDIIGSTYEFKHVKTIPYDFDIITDTMMPTDDTTCTIAVADWLLHTNKTHEELVSKLYEWCSKRPAGFGPMFLEWLKRGDGQPYGSLGNGSAMRVSPVAWVAQSLEECNNLAKISAEVTHNHPEGIKGAQVTAAAIFLNRHRYDKEYIKNYIENNYEGYEIPEYDFIKSIHKFNCTCPYSVIASLSAWYYSNSYEDCIRKAVSMNGDTDTEACIAGSICNANKETQIDDKLLTDVIYNAKYFEHDNDIIDIINEFHNKYEIS